MRESRLVYSTSGGRVCPDCQRMAGHCVCGKGPATAVPARITAKLRLETKGRAGKGVTVVDNLPDNESFLEELAQALKKSLGTGGTVRKGAIELMGDCRERLRPLLRTRGYEVKG